MSSSCEAMVPVPHPGWTALVTCGDPATAVWDYACVHEHVVRKATCAAHAPVEGAVGCRACWEAGHDCGMTFRPVSPPGPEPCPLCGGTGRVAGMRCRWCGPLKR